MAKRDQQSEVIQSKQEKDNKIPRKTEVQKEERTRMSGSQRDGKKMGYTGYWKW